MGLKSHLLIGAFAGLTLLCALWLAGAGWAAVVYGMLTDGVLAALWVMAAAGFGVWAVGWVMKSDERGNAACPQRPRDGLMRAATSAGLGLGMMSLLFLGLGLLGWLNRWSVLAILIVGWGLGIAAIARWRQKHGAAAALPPLSTRWQWMWLLIAPFAAVAVVGVMVPPGMLWPGEPNGYDVVEYHLQVPREWFDAGRIEPLDHNVFSYMPFNVEMHYLAAMELRGGPWAGMYLAQYLHLAFMVLTVAAVVAIAGQWGAVAGAFAGVAMAVVPWVTMLGTIAYNEGGVLLWGTLAVGWGMRGFEEKRKVGGAASALILAGAFAGLACGAKLTAVPVVLIAVALAGGATILFARGVSGSWISRLRTAATGVTVFVLAGVITFSPWLIRNQLWAGNPVYPELMHVLGHGDYSPAQVTRYEKAHSPRADQRSLAGRATALWEQVIADPAYAYVLWPMAAIGGVLMLTSGKRRRDGMAKVFATTRPLIPSPGTPGEGREGAFRGESGGAPSPTLPRGYTGEGENPECVCLRGEGAFLLIVIGVMGVTWIGFTHLQSRFFAPAIPVAALLIGASTAALSAKMAGKVWATIVGLALAGMAFWGVVVLGGRFDTPLLEGVIGLTDFRGLHSPEVEAAVYGSPDHPATGIVGLAGDAKAFFYQIPSSRLRYRTVFDVDAKPGESLISAWLGGEKVDRIIVDPGELSRLTRTYYGLPPVPASVAAHREMYVQSPGR